MTIKPHGSGGRILQGDTPWGRYTITLERGADQKALTITDSNGAALGTMRIVMTEPMPADFDPETEARRMKQGGCCGEPTE